MLQEAEANYRAIAGELSENENRLHSIPQPRMPRWWAVSHALGSQRFGDGQCVQGPQSHHELQVLLRASVHRCHWKVKIFIMNARSWTMFHHKRVCYKS